jgi:hypothetical protein
MIIEKTLLFISILFLLSFHTKEVYICNGKSSKKYHYKKNCKGLSNCSTDVYKVELSQAKKIGRTLCGWED